MPLLNISALFCHKIRLEYCKVGKKSLLHYSAPSRHLVSRLGKRKRPFSVQGKRALVRLRLLGSLHSLGSRSLQPVKGWHTQSEETSTVLYRKTPTVTSGSGFR